jgi:dimethylhistidine N-methyltransferase
VAERRREPKAFGRVNYEFRLAVLKGLARPQKSIPSTFFYDEVGSRLFDEICELPEYYPTRTEVAILSSRGAEIAQVLPHGLVIIEIGSGSSRKIRLILDRLSAVRAYLPIDICEDHMRASAQDLAAAYPRLEILPVVADFNATIVLPPETPKGPRLCFFPGSTIGNLHPSNAVALVTAIGALVGPGGHLLIGVDLKKDRAILERAYNDSAGVTARFNLNLLERINRDLGGMFDLDTFAHHAFYNETEGRIEMHLVSLVPQSVAVAGRIFTFDQGETIHTENSYKYSTAELGQLGEECGFSLAHIWQDPTRMFAVALFLYNS